MAELQAVVDEPIVDEEHWREVALAAAQDVRRDLDEHVLVTEAVGGFYDSLRAEAARPVLTALALCAGLGLAACGVQEAANRDVDNVADATQNRIDSMAAHMGTVVDSAASEAQETVAEVAPEPNARART